MNHDAFWARLWVLRLGHVHWNVNGCSREKGGVSQSIGKPLAMEVDHQAIPWYKGGVLPSEKALITWDSSSINVFTTIPLAFIPSCIAEVNRMPVFVKHNRRQNIWRNRVNNAWQHELSIWVLKLGSVHTLLVIKRCIQVSVCFGGPEKFWFFLFFKLVFFNVFG